MSESSDNENGGGISLDELENFTADELHEYIHTMRSLYRKKRKLNEGEKEYKKFIAYFEENMEQDERLSPADLSTLYYELAYIYYLRGQFAEASDRFYKSFEAGKSGADFVRAEIGAVLGNRMAFFSGARSAAETKGNYQKSLDKLLELYQADKDSELCKSWIESTRIHMLQLAFDTNDLPWAENLFRIVNNSDRLRRDFDDVNSKKTALRINAMMEYIKNNLDKALEYFVQYIPYDGTSIEVENSNIRISTDDSEYVAQDYYFLGLTLLKLKESDKAQDVFNLGLQLKDDNGNHYYKGLIEAKLSTI